MQKCPGDQGSSPGLQPRAPSLGLQPRVRAQLPGRPVAPRDARHRISISQCCGLLLHRAPSPALSWREWRGVPTCAKICRYKHPERSNSSEARAAIGECSTMPRAGPPRRTGVAWRGGTCAIRMAGGESWGRGVRGAFQSSAGHAEQLQPTRSACVSPRPRSTVAPRLARPGPGRG